MDVLALLLLLSACERAPFTECRESFALMLLECVIMTSMFLYGVVQPGGSVEPLTGVSGLAYVSCFGSESLQYRESTLQIESDTKSLSLVLESLID